MRAARVSASTASNERAASRRAIRSWGRFGPRDRRLDIGHVQSQDVGVLGSRGTGHTEKALRPGVVFNQRNLFAGTTGETQISERFGIDREKATGSSVLRRHVGDRRAVGQRKLVQAVAVEFDEFADHSVGAQHFHDRQDQVRGCSPIGQTARQCESDHLWNQHRDWLTEHARLRLDATHTPAEHTQAVNHRRVRVRAD